MTTVAQELMKLNKKISKRKTAYKARNERDRFSTMLLGGRLWGGDKTNIISDVSGFTVDRRFLPEENIGKVNQSQPLTSSKKMFCLTLKFKNSFD